MATAGLYGEVVWADPLARPVAGKSFDADHLELDATNYPQIARTLGISEHNLRILAQAHGPSVAKIIRFLEAASAGSG
jgi:hypothetical protein